MTVEREQASRERLETFCVSHGLDARDYHDPFMAVPRVTVTQLSALRVEAGECRKVIEGLIAALNPPILRSDGSNAFQDMSALPPLIQRVYRHVNEDPGAPISVKTLAGRLGCNANYLGSAFYKATGQRLSTVVSFARVDRAKSLLRARRFSVAEVAAMCGYEQVSHFNRIFRAVVGMTPTAFMKLPVDPS